MPPEAPPLPKPKPRAYVFFDGQNLFHDTQREYGVTHPEFCPFKLANLVCARQGWELLHARFYTGIPTEIQNRRFSVFWSNKRAAMKRLGVEFIPRVLNQRTVTIKLYDGVSVDLVSGQSYGGPLHIDNGDEVLPGAVIKSATYGEKGIDVRIAVDMIRYYAEGCYDVALLFSRDKDISEAAEEVKRLAKDEGRTVTIASAFFTSDASKRGMPSAIPIRLDRADYDAVLDPNTLKYFPRTV